MMRPIRLLALLGPLLFVAAGAAAQTAPEAPFERGVEAFREERFEEARRLFEEALERDPEHAEAHYMLARLHYETPLFDKDEAGRQIGRARALEPENVQYMVAELQQLRLPSWSNLAELIQHEKRRSLAQHILALDSTNAFAHEELGASYIRDFWEYRNAISFPFLSFGQGRPDVTERLQEERSADLTDLEMQQGGQDPTAVTPVPQTTPIGPEEGPGPGFVGVRDRFNLAHLRSQGAGALDLSSRAEAAYASAIGHLERALHYDPRRRPVYDHLMRIHALKGDYARAMPQLEQMLVFFPEDPATWRYLGLANHRLGQGEAAAKSFEKALEFMSEEEREAFEDLSILLSDEQADAYREDPAAFAARFWAAADPRYLTPYNERRLEHYARLTYADLLYAAENVGKRGWETQRGRIIIRYGAPEADVVIVGNFEEILHNFGFRAERARRFGERLDMAAQANVFNIWDYGDFRLVFEDPFRNGEYRLYSPPADLLADLSAGMVEQMDYEMAARQRFRREPERYAYESAARRVDLPYLVAAFKGEDGQSDLYVPYGVPLSPEADLSGENVDLTLRTGAFLIDEGSDVLLERRRTLYGLRTEQVASFREARLWIDAQAMAARPGRHTVSVEFETPGGATEGVQRRTLEVPDFGGERLAVSDLLLAYLVEEDFDGGEKGVEGGRIRRGNFLIEPAPWTVFAREQPVYLYFEAYNLGQDEAGQNHYAVEVALRPKDTRSGVRRFLGRLFGGEERGVSAEFEAGGTGPDDGQYTILDASGQEPGLYTLTVRVRDHVSGRAAERTTDLMLE